MRTLFNEREKDVLLALELRVDGALRAAGKGRNLSQFCSFVSVSHEDRFSSLEQKRSGLSRSEFVFVRCFDSHLSVLILVKASSIGGRITWPAMPKIVHDHIVTRVRRPTR